MGKSSINYLDYVWNPYTSRCRKVSAGCKFCYAEAMTDRYAGAGTFRGTPALRYTADKLLADIPAGQVVGVNFLSDTWHEDVPLATIQYVHSRIQERPDCIFVYTTKRHQRLAVESHKVAMPFNLWVGVSVEDAANVDRITSLRHSFARNKWVSFEPLIGGISYIPLTGIDWIVTGAESGSQRRPFDPEWAKRLGEDAHRAGATWYHKQGSHQQPGRNAKISGQLYQDVPAAFRALSQQTAPVEQPRLF